MFVIGKEYTKNDIYDILQVPHGSRKGSWDTGYRSYKDEIYIFTNVGIAGRTGVNQGNYWKEGNLVWFGKQTSHISQNLIRMMVSGEVNVNIFFRDDSVKGFTYKELGKALLVEGNKPVKIVWTFIDPDKKPSEQQTAIEGIEEIYSVFKEGGKQKTEISVYKRSIKARKKCIELNGCICKVCKLDFEKRYGSIGKGFIHIHHLKEISEITGKYTIDPEKDLILVCPNCHAMLHKKKPAYTIEELKDHLSN